MDIYLCDDNLIELAELKRLTQDAAPTTDRIYTCTTSVELFQLLSNSDVSNICVISDIKLAQEGEGIRLAQEINHRYPRIPVILCTAYIDYAKEIWNVDFCSFLTKPIKAISLRHTLEKAHKSLMSDTISLTHRGGMQRVLKRDIRYIERRGRTSYLFLAPGVEPVQTNETLECLFRRLDSSAFCMIHRSCLINLDYVKCIYGKELTLYGVDLILTVSRSWQKKLLQALADHEGSKSDASV